MSENKINVLIIGGGEKAGSIMRLFSGDENVQISGIVDSDDRAPAVKLAKETGVPVGKSCEEFLKKENINTIIDTTGSKKIKETILKTKRFDMDLLDEEGPSLVFTLINKYRETEKELEKVNKELELKTWGMEKTNEGIKTLYRELEKKNEELKKLDQVKSDFISTVSHELRTPLTIIREAVAQVLDGILGETTEEQREFLTIGLKDIDRLGRIINNLLDISKIEKGKLDIKRQPVNLVEIAKEVCASFRPKIKNKGLTIKAKCSGSEVIAYIEKDKIVQVFNNLIGNAFKFTEKGGITVIITEEEEYVKVAIADTGKGISQEDLPRLFSKFEQFGRTNGPGERGTGLGLAISKSIIELYGGKVTIESKLGKGTKFMFILPKYTSRELFVKEIQDGINEAREQDVSLSAIEIRIDKFDDLKKEIGEKKIKEILCDLKTIVEKKLHRSRDIAVCDVKSVMIVLPLTEKKDAESIISRFKETVGVYLVEENLSEKIKLVYKTATYPSEVKTIKEMFEKFRKKG